jgi:2,3-bisphosphoglycerate-dependent phosphoglycerate mutase
MKKLIMIRHGQSKWNELNLFTGWTDVDLSEKGIEEAKEAGRQLKQQGIKLDSVYTSVLTRAIKTTYYVLDELEALYLPVTKAWQLNERHYGALQGLNKKETAEKYGAEQVKLWRRSYDVLPPELNDEENKKTCIDRRYDNVSENLIPKAENLKITLERVLPYYKDKIYKDLLNDKTVAVIAHGNSLRALAKYIENISDEEITSLEIPTGVPIIYEFDDNMNFKRKYQL